MLGGRRSIGRETPGDEDTGLCGACSGACGVCHSAGDWPVVVDFIHHSQGAIDQTVRCNLPLLVCASSFAVATIALATHVDGVTRFASIVASGFVKLTSFVRNATALVNKLVCCSKISTVAAKVGSVAIQ